MTAIRQCPRCELRFRDEAELKDHLVLDHRLDREELERQLSGGVHPHHRVPDPRDRDDSSGRR